MSCKSQVCPEQSAGDRGSWSLVSPKLCQGNFSIPDPLLWYSSATADVAGAWRETDRYGDGRWWVVSFPLWAEALLVCSFCPNTHGTSEVKFLLHSFNPGAAYDVWGKVLFGAMEMLSVEGVAGKSSRVACGKALSQEIQGHENLLLPLLCWLWALQPWLRFLSPHQEKISEFQPLPTCPICLTKPLRAAHPTLERCRPFWCTWRSHLPSYLLQVLGMPPPALVWPVILLQLWLLTEAQGGQTFSSLPISQYLLTQSHKGRKCSLYSFTIGRGASSDGCYQGVKNVITEHISARYFCAFCTVADGSSLRWMQVLG